MKELKQIFFILIIALLTSHVNAQDRGDDWREFPEMENLRIEYVRPNSIYIRWDNTIETYKKEKLLLGWPPQYSEFTHYPIMTVTLVDQNGEENRNYECNYSDKIITFTTEPKHCYTYRFKLEIKWITNKTKGSYIEKANYIDSSTDVLWIENVPGYYGQREITIDKKTRVKEYRSKLTTSKVTPKATEVILNPGFSVNSKKGNISFTCIASEPWCHDRSKGDSDSKDRQCGCDDNERTSLQKNGMFLDDSGLELFALGITPNPFNESITIQTPFVGNNHVFIYNQTGSLVKQSTFQNKEYKMDLANLPKGVYIVKIIQNNQLLGVEKLIKQ